MSDIRKFNTFGMERMKQKDEEARIERMNTKQKRGTPTRDVGLQSKVFFWMMEILDEQPKGKQDYDHWISDGVVIGKVLQCCMFNSIPVDMVSQPNLVKKTAPPDANGNDSSKNGKKKRAQVAVDEHECLALDKAAEDRIKSVLKYLKKFGVPEKYLFEVQDLKEMSNIPKVTRCIAMLGKMAGEESLKNVTIEIPTDDDHSHLANNDEDE